MTPAGERGRPWWAALTPLSGLRIFLGFVYLYAGVSKIADRRFLDAAAPSSIHQSVLAAKAASPIGALLGPVVDHSAAFGVIIAIGETAVGIGMLAGLFVRVAAAGGALLALGLWLTVSWHASPWYTSADVIYLVAFTPFLFGAAPGPWSADSWLARVEQHGERAGDGTTRRALVGGLALIGGAAVLGAATLFRKSGRLASDAGPAGPVALVAADKVPVGGAVKADASGSPYFVTQPTAGQYAVLDAVCPHQGCTVDFVSAADGFVCPCHSSRFGYDGHRLSGPAPHGLKRYTGTDDNGEITFGG